jgi:hypothetical protein
MELNLMKTVHYSYFLACLYFIFPTSAVAKTDVNIQLNKSAETLTLIYTTDTLAQKIAFVSNPNDSRTKRWEPVNNEFEVIYEDHQEFIQRIDGKAFNYVQLSLTPTYKHLPKAYAPFAPFSDGGVLIHTGRLFACIDLCSDDANGWRIKIEVKDNTHFIANGKVNHQPASWLGYDDGQYVYIGQQKPIDEPTFLAIIDQGLPEKMKIELSQSLPKTMTFFESRLGENSSSVKPMLFASYSNEKGKDIQGGVLPNQVFIHWDMDNLDEKLKEKNFINRTLWMFAHEASHFYQDSALLVSDKSESWIHEGNAEWLSAIALREFYPEIIEPFISKKLNQAKSDCANALTKYSLEDAARKGNYRAYYQCGIIIHSLIDKKTRELSKGKKSIFNVWNDFKEQGKNKGKTGAVGFWAVTEKYISSDMLQGLRNLTTDKLADPENHINRLESL